MQSLSKLGVVKGVLSTKTAIVLQLKLNVANACVRDMLDIQGGDEE